MKQLICPVDGKPCDPQCPDRYIDREQGGCFLTTAQELGFTLMNLGGGNVAAVYAPSN